MAVLLVMMAPLAVTWFSTLWSVSTAATRTTWVERNSFELWCDGLPATHSPPYLVARWAKQGYCWFHGYVGIPEAPVEPEEWDWPLYVRLRWVFEFTWASKFSKQIGKALWWCVDQLGAMALGGDTWMATKTVIYFMAVSTLLMLLVYGLDWVVRPLV